MCVWKKGKYFKVRGRMKASEVRVAVIQDNMFFYTSSSVLNKEDFFQLIEDDIKLKKLPFDDELIDFANSLAKILLSKKLREFPSLLR